jgi:hypothetical protein
MKEEVFCHAINIKQRLAITEEGEFGDIKCYLDMDGDETQDFEIATIAIVHWRSDGGWSYLVLRDFEDHTLE